MSNKSIIFIYALLTFAASIIVFLTSIVLFVFFPMAVWLLACSAALGLSGILYKENYVVQKNIKNFIS